MEFVLAKEKRCTFVTCASGSDFHRKKCEMTHLPLSLDPPNDCAEKGASKDGEPSEGISFRKDLLALLCGNSLISQDNPNPIPKSFQLNIVVTLKSTNFGYAKVFMGGLDNMNVNQVQSDVPIFEQLMNSCLPPASFGFNLTVKLFLDGISGTNHVEINEKDLRISQILRPRLIFYDNTNERYRLLTGNINPANEIWRQWNDDGATFEGEVTLTLLLDHCAVKNLYQQRFGKDHFIEWPRKMLADGFGSDMVILAGGEKDKEKGIKCHKFVLSDRSIVFKTMFHSELSESKENSVEIKDMTEAGVRIFLKYVYCWDLEEAVKNCEVALELLMAGHKYHMEDLEEAMIGIFDVMPFKWFSVDLAVKLLLFSRNVCDKFGKIEKRCLEVLKWYAHKPGSLKGSEEYRTLFVEHPLIAMDMAELFLKI